MQTVFIQFGVNVRGLKETMPEHVGHLFETDPASDHLGCRRMSESMGTQSARRDPGQFEMALGDATHRTDSRKGTEWRTGTQEEERLSAFGPAVLHVFSKGLAYVTRQGQLSFPSGFRGMDSNLSFSPIDI